MLRSSRSSLESSASGTSSAAKGAKFSEIRSKPFARAHSTVSQISHSLKPFGVERSRGIDESDSAEPARHTAKCRNPAGAPSGFRPTTKSASPSPSRKERVEGPHEAALRLRAAPRVRELLELPPKRRVELARAQDLGAVALALQPVHGLPHLPDRPALERERLDLEHRLVAVVERMQPPLAVEAEAGLGGAEDRKPPAAFPHIGDEAVEQFAELGGRADRVAGDDRHAPDDPVRHKGATALREEVRLVRAKHERGQRVHAPGGDELACQRPLARLLAQPVAPRRDPPQQEPGPDRQPREEDREREPVVEGRPEVGRTAEPRADERGARLPQYQPERERLVNRELVEPEREPAIGEDPAREQQSPQEESRPRRGIAGSVELVPVGDERDREQRRHHRSGVEAVQDVQHARAPEQAERDLPGALLPPLEAARDDEQRERERAEQGARDRPHRVGGERREERQIV